MSEPSEDKVLETARLIDALIQQNRAEERERVIEQACEAIERTAEIPRHWRKDACAAIRALKEKKG